MEDISAAVQKVRSAVQTIETNVANGPQTRPTKWEMVVRYKYTQTDSMASSEVVTVNATSLDDAKEKAKHAVKSRYNWAYIVDAEVYQY
jgi:hypothetical protein